MIRSLKLYFIFAIFLSACNNKNPHEHELIGEWERTGIKPVSGSLITLFFGFNGFSFNSDGTVEYKDGFFKKNGDRQKGQIYLGKTSTYKLSKDNLTIYAPDTKQPISYKLTKLSADTLAFIIGNNEIYFKKRHPVKHKNKDVDNIIFSSTTCLGSCPSLSISIDKDGNIIFVGNYFVDKIGVYYAKTDKKVFENLLSEMNKTNIDNLERKYTDHDVDIATYYTLLCNGNTINKSILDEGGNAPKTWLWNYPSLQYLYQQVPLKKLQLPKYLLYLTEGNAQYNKKDSVLYLTYSEKLYLLCKLKNGKRCKPRALPYKLNIDTYKRHVLDVETDGRYYSFTRFTDGVNITIDIGFDLLKQQLNVDGWKRTE